METKEIDGVLYELVPEEKKKSCRGCAFYGPDGSVCTTLTDNCNKGFIYKEIDKPISTSNLKSFNLEEAKAGKSVCTREGKKARIICFDKQGGLPIVALVETKKNGRVSEELDLFYINGHAISVDTDSKHDLMMLPEKKKGWAVIRKGDIYETEELARKEMLDSRTAITIRKISWEE